MVKPVLIAFIVTLLFGCSSDITIVTPAASESRPMPTIRQSVTPSQQRAIMTGDRPDWSEVAVPENKHKPEPVPTPGSKPEPGVIIGG